MGTKVQEERECGTGGGTLGPPVSPPSPPPTFTDKTLHL